MKGGLPTPITKPCTNPEIPVGGVSVPAWRWHMKADIAHDGGAAVLGYSSMQLHAVYGGMNTRIPRQGWDTLGLDENTVRDTLLASTLYTDKPGRPSVNFLLRPATDQYTDEKDQPIVFNPFGGDEVAVFHDAGLPMFDRIPNGKNAIGFGTPIDPAPKPQGVPGEIIDAFGGSISIPGCTFGFDPSVIGDIVISEFDGKKVKIGINMNIPGIPGDMRLYDGATGRFVEPGALTYKVINKPSGLFAGNGANGRMTGSPNDIPYFVGKALCDALQVTACMPEIWTQGGVPIQNWNPKPMTRLLNTGDRLEYVRAVLMGVSCIYLGPKDKETKARSGVFTPGSGAIKSDADLKTEYDSKLEGVYVSAETRWKACEDDIKLALQVAPPPAPPQFNVRYAYFEGSPYIDMGNPNQVAAVTAFMEACRDVIGAAKTNTLAYFRGAVDGTVALDAGQISDKIAAYSQLLSELDSRCPTGRILKATNMPRVFRVTNTEDTEVTIKFFKGFEAIKRLPPPPALPPLPAVWEPALVRIGYPPAVPAGGVRLPTTSAINAARLALQEERYGKAVNARIAPRYEAVDLKRFRAERAATTAACVARFNSFLCAINAEQARILGIKGGAVYGKAGSELSKEWVEAATEYKTLADTYDSSELGAQISSELETEYWKSTEYAIAVGVVGRLVADEQNQNDFTDFLSFLFPDLVYPSSLVTEDDEMKRREKNVCKAVLFAERVLRAGVLRSNLLDPDFHNEVYRQCIGLVSILIGASQPAIIEEEGKEDEDEYGGGGRRKTHRRRKLPKLL
jgi:hypothetical protein